MSDITAIRDWLLLVGPQYGIREAHHNLRVSDDTKPVRDFFVYRWASSDTRQTDTVEHVTASGNDATIRLTKVHDRVLEVECHCEHGMRALETLEASRQHPRVLEILDAGSVVIVSLQSIENDTDVTDESYSSGIDHVYVARFTARVEGAYVETRTDHIWDNYNVTGEYRDDEGGTIPVVATDL